MASRRFTSAKRSLAVIAAWQFATFFMLLLLIWVNEVLDLPKLFYNAKSTHLDIFRASVISAAVIVVAIITVGHTYITQRRMLSNILTVCAQCKRVKIDHEVWEGMERYMTQSSGIRLSHGLCPECYQIEISALAERQANPPKTGSSNVRPDAS